MLILILLVLSIAVLTSLLFCRLDYISTENLQTPSKLVDNFLSDYEIVIVKIIARIRSPDTCLIGVL